MVDVADNAVFLAARCEDCARVKLSKGHDVLSE
jgi:hypothetical protein